VCKRPITYNADLARWAASTLPYAALWNLAFSLWAFSFFQVQLYSTKTLFISSYIYMYIYT
jgi:hypothetical protein